MARESVTYLTTKAQTDPWNAVIGRPAQNYQLPEIGEGLIESVNLALFERKIEDALRRAFILERWAEYDRHYSCRASALLSSVYTVCGMSMYAELRLADAQNHAARCSQCAPYVLKRMGSFSLYQRDTEKANAHYTRAIALFRKAGNTREVAKCFLNRGVSYWVEENYTNALRDEEKALTLLDPADMNYIVIGHVNIAAILMRQGDFSRAMIKIEEAKFVLSGMENAEIPRMKLRWTRGLILEEEGKNTEAQRVFKGLNKRFIVLEMWHERRVLLADLARVYADLNKRRSVAREARGIEKSPSMIKIIDAVITEPTMENLKKWRNSLDSFVKPLHAEV